MERTKQKLTDVCTIQYGYAFDSKKFSEDSGNIALIRIRDVKGGVSNTYYTGEYDESYLVKPGEILIGMDGEFNIAKWKSEPALLNQRVCKISGKENIVEDYLHYYLSLELKTIERRTSFVTVKHLSAKELNALTLEIHSYEEQEKIANQLNLTETIIEKRNQQLSDLDNLIKSRFVEMFGDPVHNTKRWPVKKLGDMSVKINSGNTPKGGEQVYVDQGIKFFRSQNVWKDRLEMDDIAYIDEATHASMSRSSLKHGDILMTKTGRINTENSSLGRAALYMGEDDAANVNGHVYFIRLKSGVNNKFVLRILVSNEYRDYLRSVCVGGIDKRQLNKDHIENFPIICPPEDKVNEYIAFVEHVDKLKFDVQKSLVETQILFDSFIQKYFS